MAKAKRLWCWLVGHQWQEFSFTEFTEYIPADENHGNICGGGKRRQLVLCQRCLAHA